MQLKSWWNKYNHFWITIKNLNTIDRLKKEKVYLGYSPENTNILNAFKHQFLAIYILIKENPFSVQL